jgi:hypothetical protein
VLLGRLDEAVSIQPADPELRQLRIRRAHETGDMTFLLDDTRRLVALSGSNEARYGMAMALIQAGNASEGLDTLRELLEETAARASSDLPEEYGTWLVNYAVLCVRHDRRPDAYEALESVPTEEIGSSATPVDPGTLLSLLRLEDGDRRGALAALETSSRPSNGMLRELLRVTITGTSDLSELRRTGMPAPSGVSPGPRFLTWKDQSLEFDLEPIARGLLRRDPRSLAGRYLLADALGSKLQPRDPLQPPDPRTREALELLHGLTRDCPGWGAPFECLTSMSIRLGHMERASALQRMVGELYSDLDRGRWLWRNPVNGGRPGMQGYLR